MLGFDSASILAAIALGKLPQDVARRALDLCLEQARQAGELSGFTAGHATAVCEREQFDRAAQQLTEALLGIEVNR